MINPVLERKYEDCTELVEAWKAYHDLFNSVIGEEKPDLSPEAEHHFLNVKAKIAMLHDSLLESIKHDQNIAQNMLDIVNRSITLRHLRKMGEPDQKKIEIEWHDCYLLLHETVTSLNDKRESIADINEFNHKMDKYKESVWLSIKKFLQSWYFKAIIAVVVLAGIFLFTPASAWNSLRTMPGVGGPMIKLQDQLRIVFDFDTPYSSIEQYVVEKLDPANLPERYIAESATGDVATDSSVFGDLFQVAGENAGDYLKSAEGYAKYTVTDDEEGLDVSAMMFFWTQPGGPRRFSREVDNFSSSDNQMASFIETQYTIHHDENVLVILQNGPTDIRDEMMRSVFRY